MRRRAFLLGGGGSLAAAALQRIAPAIAQQRSTRWPTMVFGREVRAVDDPWGDERRSMAAARAAARV